MTPAELRTMVNRMNPNLNCSTSQLWIRLSNLSWHQVVTQRIQEDLTPKHSLKTTVLAPKVRLVTLLERPPGKLPSRSSKARSWLTKEGCKSSKQSFCDNVKKMSRQSKPSRNFAKI